MTALRDMVAKEIYKLSGTWSQCRADEHFAAYQENPRNVEPEFAIGINEAYQFADVAIGLIFARCIAIADECAAQDEIDNGAAATGSAKTAATRIRELN